MQKYKSVWDGHLERITLPKHKIILNLPDSSPIHSAPNGAGPEQRQLEREEATQMMKARTFKPGVTEWSSPFVFVPKKNSGICFYVDHRRLDAIVVSDSYPITCKGERTNSLGEEKLLSILEARSESCQIEMAKKAST